MLIYPRLLFTLHVIQNRHSTTNKVQTPSDQNLALSHATIDVLNIFNGSLDR